MVKRLFFVALLTSLILTYQCWSDGGHDENDDEKNFSKGGFDTKRGCSGGVANGGPGGEGGDGKGGSPGGEGGRGGDGGSIWRRKRAVERGQLFSPRFEVYDDDKDGQITLEEFLNVRPEGKQLFNFVDVDGNQELSCEEFSRAVLQFGGNPTC